MAREIPLGQGIKTSTFPVKRSMQLKALTQEIKGGVKTYNYWTNFDRKNPEKFEVIKEEPTDLFMNVCTGWWRFTTNIPPDDFDFNWDDRQKRRFLFQMDEIYNFRRAEPKDERLA